MVEEMSNQIHIGKVHWNIKRSNEDHTIISFLILSLITTLHIGNVKRQHSPYSWHITWLRTIQDFPVLTTFVTFCEWSWTKLQNMACPKWPIFFKSGKSGNGLTVVVTWSRLHLGLEWTMAVANFVCEFYYAKKPRYDAHIYFGLSHFSQSLAF